MQVVEHSLHFGYVLAHSAHTDTYYIFARDLTEVVYKLVAEVNDLNPRALVTVITDATRAEMLPDSTDKWRVLIKYINLEYNDYVAV